MPGTKSKTAKRVKGVILLVIGIVLLAWCGLMMMRIVNGGGSVTMFGYAWTIIALLLAISGGINLLQSLRTDNRTDRP